VCFCWHGFRLSMDTRKCLDIDECQTFGVCSQRCVNTRGSFKCLCGQGYVSDGLDGRDCKAEGTLVGATWQTVQGGEKVACIQGRGVGNNTAVRLVLQNPEWLCMPLKF